MSEITEFHSDPVTWVPRGIARNLLRGDKMGSGDRSPQQVPGAELRWEWRHTECITVF